MHRMKHFHYGFVVNSSSAKHFGICIHMSAGEEIKLNKDINALEIRARVEMIRCFRNKRKIEENKLNSSPKTAMQFLSDLF